MNIHNNKEFDALLRRKFDDYEVELPKDDWEIFSQKLTANQPKRRSFVWYYGAAASIIGLLFLGISFFTVHENAPKFTQHTPSGVNNLGSTKMPATLIASTTKEVNAATHATSQPAFTTATLKTTKSAAENEKNNNGVESQTTVATAAVPPSTQNETTPVAATTSNYQVVKNNAQSTNAIAQTSADTTGYITHPVTQYAELPPLPAVNTENEVKSSKNKLNGSSINWLAANFQGNVGVTPGGSSDLASSSLSSQLYSRASKAATLEASSTPTLISFASNKTYYLPLTFGLSTGFRIAPRWELQSGIVYTLLITTGDVGYSAIRSTGRIEQHYLGVPVSLAYAFIQQPSFSVYVSGGGKIEKGVSLVEKIYTYNSQNNPIEQVRYKYAINGVQLALDAGVGASYRLYHFINWYIEVGGAWYIPSNQPESSRTVHPFNVALKTGLRFSLYK